MTNSTTMSDLIDPAPPSQPAATPTRFVRERRIRFSDCDPAGIVFYPQYLVMFNGLVEDWFTEQLGVSYAGLLGHRRIGLPIVRLECDFRAVGRMGDDVQLGLAVERAGTRSITLNLECRAGKVLRVSSRQVLVFTNLDSHAAIDMPADVRAAMDTFVR